MWLLCRHMCAAYVCVIQEHPSSHILCSHAHIIYKYMCVYHARITKAKNVLWMLLSEVWSLVHASTHHVNLSSSFLVFLVGTWGNRHLLVMNKLLRSSKQVNEATRHYDEDEANTRASEISPGSRTEAPIWLHACTLPGTMAGEYPLRTAG